jgi:uncharacterized protein (DUF2062 family)
MFRRRVPLSFTARVRDWVWPRIGLRRALTFHWHRLKRLPGTPDSIAAGFGWGLAISMTPLLGGHMALSALFAWVFRSSILAASIATFALNPWTAPPVWLATYYTGRVLDGQSLGEVPSFLRMFSGMGEALATRDWELFMRDVWPVFKPMLVGSVPLAIVAGLGSYVLLHTALSRFRDRRREVTNLSSVG